MDKRKSNQQQKLGRVTSTETLMETYEKFLQLYLAKSDSAHPVKWNQNNYPFDEEPGEPSGDMV